MIETPLSDMPSAKALDLINLCATMNETLQALLDESIEILALHDRRRLTRKQLHILQQMTRNNVGQTRDIVCRVGIYIANLSNVMCEDLRARLQTDGTYLNDPPEIDL